MSAIPPNPVAAGIQAFGAAQRASESKRKEDSAGEAGRGEFTEKLLDVIENSDRDSEVYADAEGTGSQGKDHPAPDDEASETDPNDDPPPLGGLDLTA